MANEFRTPLITEIYRRKALQPEFPNRSQGAGPPGPPSSGPPFFQTDWPLFSTARELKGQYLHVTGFRSPGPIPFRQNDFPLPPMRGRDLAGQDFEAISYRQKPYTSILTFFNSPFDTFFPRRLAHQPYFPNRHDKAQAPFVPFPFSNHDWPIPYGSRDLRGQDFAHAGYYAVTGPPFYQGDFPNPFKRKWFDPSEVFPRLRIANIAAQTIPFENYDQPNPFKRKYFDPSEVFPRLEIAPVGAQTQPFLNVDFNFVFRRDALESLYFESLVYHSKQGIVILPPSNYDWPIVERSYPKFVVTNYADYANGVLPNIVPPAPPPVIFAGAGPIYGVLSASRIFGVFS